MGRFARQFSGIYKDIAEDPLKFCRAINFNPTWQQRQLLEAIRRGERRIACKSGQGPGKTTCSAVIGLWFAMRAYQALTVVTAPTMRQCRDVWLVEARRLMARADPLLQRFIKVTKSRVEIAGMPDWGCKMVTATREENAQGYHAENMMVIGEEASGIPRELMTQFKGTLSNPNSIFVLIGNPNTRDCAFFDCFNSQRHLWHPITWNAEETPASEWFDPARNKQLEDEFGRDSDVYRVRVLGEFPHSDPNCVLSTEMLDKVTDKRLMLHAAQMLRLVTRPGEGPARQFGLDFARYGGDENVIFQRSGNAIIDFAKFAHTDPNLVIDRAFLMQKESYWKDKETWYVADAGGMGQGVMFRFHSAEKRVLEFHFGGKAIDSDYDNRVSEAWFHLARMVKKRICYLPADNVLIQQLCNRQYFTTKKGKLVIESKDEYMKRGYESPDRADACVLSMYDGVIAQGQSVRMGGSQKQVGVALQR